MSFVFLPLTHTVSWSFFPTKKPFGDSFFLLFEKSQHGENCRCFGIGGAWKSQNGIIRCVRIGMIYLCTFVFFYCCENIIIIIADWCGAIFYFCCFCHGKHVSRARPQETEKMVIIPWKCDKHAKSTKRHIKIYLKTANPFGKVVFLNQ